MIFRSGRGITFIIPPVYHPIKGGVNKNGRTHGENFWKILSRDYTCDGQDISPEIDVGGLNQKITKSLAIFVNDPDAPNGEFVHWIAWNMEPVRKIPEKIPRIPDTTFPLKAVQGKNNFGKIGYDGPCPPHGQTHRFFFKVYGLDSDLSLAAGATKDQLAKAMEGHVVQYGETYVKYGR